MKGILFALWGALMLTASGWSAAAGLKLTVLVDNTAHAPGTKGRWGFACLVENAGPAPILFDTGPDAAVLAENARRLGVDLGAVGWVVLSHEHHDHIGGLAAALAAAPRATICPLGAFAAALAPTVRKAGAALKPLDEPTELCPGVWTTGALGRRIRAGAGAGHARRAGGDHRVRASGRRGDGGSEIRHPAERGDPAGAGRIPPGRSE